MSNHKNLIKKINAGNYSEQECINLHSNAQKHNEFEVIEAIKLQMCAQFPRAAKRIFGEKHIEVQSKLEEVLITISKKFDLSKSRVKTHLKTGGNMISGTFHIEQYISYKNANQDGVLLSLTQKEINSELFATVERYKTGTGGYSNKKLFNMDYFSDAVDEYTKELTTLVV